MIFLCALLSTAQEVMFKNYNELNGLPSSEAYFVFEDHDGFIWIATDNGVVRFDGGEFKLFNKSNGLADAVVFSIVEDPQRQLWFRTFSGATSVYKDGRLKPYPFNDLLKSLRGSVEIRSLIVDSLSQVCVSGSQTGAFKISPDGKLDTIKTRPRAINFIEIIKDEFLISIMAGVGLDHVVYNGKPYDFAFPPKRATGFMFCKRWNDQFYFSVDNLLYKIGSERAELVLTAKEPIISLAVDRQNNFWLGFLADGAIRFSDNTFRHGLEIDELKRRSVTSVWQDKAGGFWFSTLEKGVFYSSSLKMRSYDLPEDSKTNFLISNDNSVIVGFYNGALVKIDKYTKKIKWSLNLGKPVVAGAFLEKDNQLLISTSRNSVILSTDGKVIKDYDPYVMSNVGTKLIAKKFFKTRDRYWGVNIFGALEFDHNGKLLSFHSLKFWSRNILVKKHEVFLAGITGLFKTDTTFAEVTEMKEFSNDKVSDLVLLPDGKIFVGTVGNGFKIIDGEKIIPYSKTDGLVFENVYSAVADRFLWLATEKGIVKLKFDFLLQKKFVDFDLLDKNSGLMNNKVNFIVRDGRETWCIYNNGFSIFNEDEINYANKTPVPHVNGVRVNSRDIEPSRLLDLRYDENNIAFDFGFLSYNNRNIFLRHRAKASDQWNYTEDFVVNYYALAPGRYAFEVEYSTDRLHWRKIQFANQVTIQPVWWETIYFRLTILLVAALLIFIYFRAKYNARLLKLELAEKLKAEKERIAQDLHDNIGSKLVSLSLGLNHVVKEYEIASDTADMIYSNVNTTVLELRDTIWAIQKEGITIAEFCDKIKNLVWRLRQNKGSLQYDLQIKTESDNHVLKPTQAINLYRIVQESIANSQKHSGASAVTIQIHQELNKSSLSIEVIDNGNGFSLANSTSNGSYGLKNMKSRAIEVNASFEILSNAGGGTRVVTSLPL